MKTSTATVARTIVIAWTESDQVWDGQPYANDLGHRAGMAAVTTAHAVVWLNEGTKADERKAKAHAATITGGRVLTFATSVTDPIERGRARILRLQAG